MLGAIAGDIIGSVHEYSGIKTKDFPLFSIRSKFKDDSKKIYFKINKGGKEIR